MKEYLLTAAGVIFLSVIVALLVPEGKLNKTIVFVMRMICIFVLLQPITGLFKISNVATDQPMYDYEYISEVYSDNQSEQLKTIIKQEFNTECECFVEITYSEGNFKVKSVRVEVNLNDGKIIDEIYAYLEEKGYINITVYAKSN